MLIPFLALLQAATATPAWTYNETKAEFDGASSQLAVRLSENDVTNILGRGERAGLGLRCSDNKLSMIISWPAYIGQTPGLLYIKWRLDDGPVTETSVNQASGDQGTLFLDKKSRTAIMAGMTSAKALKVRVPGRSGEQDATFSLEGAPVEKFAGCGKKG